MAEYRASIFGTEMDTVNCSFFYKVGACRHGEHCSRVHHQPLFSQTVLLKHLYIDPKYTELTNDGVTFYVNDVSDQEAQEHFENFFEDVFVECEEKYGEIEQLKVCNNQGAHLNGNVYIKFKFENDAKRAVDDLNNRWFGGKPIYAELSPVTDFKGACCSKYKFGTCNRQSYCNFLHTKPISKELTHYLFYSRNKPRGRQVYHHRNRSRSPRYRHRRR
uniref:Putative u2 snrnp splicing factor small subunit n=1 Tax=Panstrongylus lignarius TaxID=156445 RepID=A0A224XXI7_9HEMI